MKSSKNVNVLNFNEKYSLLKSKNYNLKIIIVINKIQVFTQTIKFIKSSASLSYCLW